MQTYYLESRRRILDGSGLAKAIQHPRKAQSVENEAVTVQSVSEAAVMLYGLATVR